MTNRSILSSTSDTANRQRLQLLRGKRKELSLNLNAELKAADLRMGDHGPRIDHIIICAKDLDKASKHIYEV